ncbi:hypothetical protein [Mailhella sp.]
MQVNSQNQTTQAELVQQAVAEFLKGLGKVTGQGGEDGIPGVSISFDIDELPSLPAPAGPLSLDTLLNAIGDETRRQACRDGVASLELKGEQQAEVNQKELDELKEQLEKMAKKGLADTFLKIFSVIGMVVGAIASAASIAIGAATGNPLLVAAGIAGIAMTVDSALSMATDGKYCIAGLVSTTCEACGMDKESAQWVGMGVTMALNLATIALNIGGAVKAVSVTADAANKVMQILSKTTLITNIVSGANSVASGATSIASGVYSYQISMSQAEVKELEAILERIRMAIEMEQEMVQNEMERANALLEAVDAIVDACNKTQGTVLAMSPTMA